MVYVCEPLGLGSGIWELGWERRAGVAGEVVGRCLTLRGQGAPMTSSWCASTYECCCWRHWKGWLGRISKPCRCLRGLCWRTCCPSSSTTMSRAFGNRRPCLIRQAPVFRPAPTEPLGRYVACTKSKEVECGLVSATVALGCNHTSAG